MRLRSSIQAVASALSAGVQLTLLRPPPQKAFVATPAALFVLLALGQLASFAVSYIAVEPPKDFDEHAIRSEAFYFLIVLGICFAICAAHGQRYKVLTFVTLMTGAGLFAGNIQMLANDHVVPWAVEHNARVGAWFYLVWIVWWLAIWHRAVSMLALGTPRSRFASAVAAVVILATLPQVVFPDRYWQRDYAALYEQENGASKALIAEEVFAAQPALLDKALASLAPEVPGQPDLYFVAFGPYGYQDVFLKESLYSSRLFATRFGAKDRVLTLVNNDEKVDELPLATMTNLRHALGRIGAAMDPAEDILFLFLTSHGSRDASLSIELSGLSFLPLTAQTLASALAESGIRWKVLIVSGCYSGTFLEPLKDDHTLVISASRADRTSFGCSDGAEFTYFGRAFFKDALSQTRSFTEAFAIASKLLSEWETQEGREKSEPQMAKGALIEAHLARWQATLPPDK